MPCDHCTDDDGDLLYPSYGPAPHVCFHKIPGAIHGQSAVLPKGEWPNNFVEDPDCAGLGTYFCPQCGFGKPENADDTI